jgi:hypothetical protein
VREKGVEKGNGEVSVTHFDAGKKTILVEAQDKV